MPRNLLYKAVMNTVQLALRANPCNPFTLNSFPLSQSISACSSSSSLHISHFPPISFLLNYDDIADWPFLLTGITEALMNGKN